MHIQLKWPLAVEVVMILFFQAIKETDCRHTWDPELFEIPTKNFGQFKKIGVVAYKKNKDERIATKKYIILQPLLFRVDSFVTTKTIDANVSFGTSKHNNLLYSIEENPSGIRDRLLYGKDFEKILAKFKKLLNEPIDDAILRHLQRLPIKK